jgi:hypothetical protein
MVPGADSHIGAQPGCGLEAVPADQATDELGKCFVDVGAVPPADPQAFELVQPGRRAFHDPALQAQPGAVCGAAPGDPPPDSASPQRPPVADYIASGRIEARPLAEAS